MRLRIIAGMMLALSLVSTQGQAFMLGQTRLILNQDDGSATILVVSGEKDPLYLVRAKITQTLDDEKAVSHFLVTPPLFRLEPKMRSTLRISVVGGNGLPADRERLFYLKVAAIPSSNPLDRNTKTGYTGASVLMGTGNIIKMIYRPHGVGAVTPGLISALAYSRVPGGIQVSNPSPNYISFSSLSVDGKVLKFSDKQPAMLPPFSHQIYGVNSTLKKQVAWRVLDDQGTAQSGTSPVQ